MASDLLSFIVDPEDGDTSLHLAALSGDVDYVREFLRRDSGRELINVRLRPFGATPLRLAASAGKVKCVRELLKNGAFIDLADIKAQTPLFVAVHNNHLKCCEVLLKSGANPNGDSRNLVSPLQVVCQTGNAAAAYLLLQHGSAIVGASTHPLHVTAIYGHLNCYILLLLHGAISSLTENDVVLRSILPVLAKKSNPVFLHLWVLFGGSLWFHDENGIHKFLDIGEGPLTEILHTLKTVPLSLKSQCRIIIWRVMQNNILERIKSLGLPITLINFLAFRDIPEVDSCLFFLDSLKNEFFV